MLGCFCSRDIPSRYVCRFIICIANTLSGMGTADIKQLPACAKSNNRFCLFNIKNRHILANLQRFVVQMHC